MALVLIHSDLVEASVNFKNQYGANCASILQPDAQGNPPIPYLQGYPSVMADVPAYVVPAQTTEGVNPDGTSYTMTRPEINVSACKRILYNPADWNAVTAWLTQIEAYVVPATFVSAKADKLAQINALADAASAPILAKYSATEQASFSAQAIEANAWQVNNSSPTPTIAAIASQTGTTVAALVPVILSNAGALIGIITQAQNYRKQLAAIVSDGTPAGDAAGITAVDVIKPVYTSASS